MLARISLVLFAFSFASGVFADEIKLGFVDIQRLITEVDEGVKARAELKKDFDKKQGILDAKQNEVKTLQEQLQKGGALLEPKTREQKTMELQEKLGQTQQLYMTMQQEMMKKEQEAMGGILQKSETVLQAILNDGDYTMILKKNRAALMDSAVLAAKPSLDLTNEAIRRYNGAYKGSAKKDSKKSK